MRRAARSRGSLLVAIVLCLVVADESQGNGDIYGVFMDVGSPTNTPTRRDITDDLRLLRDHLNEVARVPTENISIATGARLSRSDMRERLNSLANGAPSDAAALVYVRAYVTKSPKDNAIYIYPGDADATAPITAEPRPIRDSEFAKWLEVFDDKPVILLFDFRTEDPSLDVYFSNRIGLGSASVSMVASGATPWSMARLLANVMDESADEDQDSVLQMGEVTYALQNKGYDSGLAIADAVFSATGAPDVPLYELPSALFVSAMIGSQVFIDGEAVGEAPMRYAATEMREYSVSVAREGFHEPEPKTAMISKPYGDAAILRFPLEPIAVRASIQPPAGASIGSLVIGILPDVGFRDELSGALEVVINTREHDFETGTEYELLAGTPDERYFGASSFTFGGHGDISLSIALRERTLWEVASIYFDKDYRDQALAAATQARNADYDIPKLSEDFMYFLIEKWAVDTGYARAMIGCAILAYYLGDPETSREYWKLAKQVARKGSADYEFASQGLRSAGGDGSIYFVAGLFLFIAVSFTVVMILRHRRTSRENEQHRF